MRMNAAVLTCLMLWAAAPASANESSTTDLAKIRAQQIEFRQQAMDKSGPFKDMAETDRQALITRQNQFITLTEGKGALSDLKRDDQTLAINTLESIKAAITQAEDERLICERVKLVGSNRPTRICKTVAERRIERAEAEKTMEERKMCGAACKSN